MVPVINLLKASFGANPSAGEGDTYEYRLLLSGCAFNGDLVGDYTKSDAGGLLLDQPVALWKVGRSYDDYPQELALWIKVPPVTTNKGICNSTSTPHEAIANDIAALLTLFFRRLVVVVGATSVTLPTPYNKTPLPSAWPQPIVSASRNAYSWPRLPLTAIYGPNGVTYSDPNAQDVAVSPNELREFLHRLSEHKHATRIISAARQYHRAMECLLGQTELSYLLLVIAAEAVATVVEPKRTDDEVLSLGPVNKVLKLVKELGMSDADAKQVALCSADAFNWRRKSKGQMFEDFLVNYGCGHRDVPVLFNPEVLDLFKVADDTSAIGKAYNARGGYVHAAASFKPASLTGTSSSIPASVAFDLMVDASEGQEGTTTLPPIIWFERIVAHSLKRYVFAGCTASSVE